MHDPIKSKNHHQNKRIYGIYRCNSDLYYYRCLFGLYVDTLSVSSEEQFLILYELSIYYSFNIHTLTVSSEGNFLILYEFSKALLGCTVLGLPSFIPKYNPIGLAIKLQWKKNTILTYKSQQMFQVRQQIWNVCFFDQAPLHLASQWASVTKFFKSLNSILNSNPYMKNALIWG